MSSLSVDRAPSSGAGELWSPTPVIEWLILDGWRIESTPDLIEALARRLAGGGVPLWRLFCLVPTLHPVYVGKGYRWNRDDPEIFQGFGEHGVQGLPEFLDNPMKLVIDDGFAGVRRRIPGNYTVGEFPLLDELREQGATDYVCMPLEFTSGERTAISFATDHPDGFSAGDLKQFNDLLPVVARLIERETLRSTTENLLDTYVGNHAGRRILRGQIKRGMVDSIDAAIWYGDLRGFTPMSESMPRDAVLATLNSYFETMAVPIHKQGGQVLKFIGDAMLAIFPLEEAANVEEACARALDAANEAVAGMETLNADRAAAGQPPLEFGLALHVGEVTYGNIGAVNRLDFTVIGPAVNLAHRIEQLCKVMGRRPLLSGDFARACGLPTESVGEHALRGLSRPHEVYAPLSAG
ncbi:MAG: adenylate/guanylate cyclase domain-containing protein [Inquilinus sp.]|nr:adenylate/guanylate cyclase domain-containing protein [Inquilinus sp.]